MKNRQDIKSLSPSTIKKYDSIISKKEYESDNPSSIYEDLISKSLSIGYMTTYLNAYLNNYRKRDTVDDKIVNIYRDILYKLKKEQTSIDGENIQTHEMKSWATYKKKALSKKHNDVDRLIGALYTHIPPRRLEYSDMVFVNKSSSMKSKKYNYYVKEDETFIFNEYKSKGAFGTQKVKVPYRLRDILNEYIKTHKIKNGQSLLNMNRNALSKRITRLFGDSLNSLRHSYITDAYKKNKNTNQLKDIASNMAHSVNRQLLYRKYKP